MATPMEKDVLMEVLSGVYVLVLRSNIDNEEDLNKLLDLKNSIYKTQSSDIDFECSIEILKKLRTKYE